MERKRYKQERQTDKQKEKDINRRDRKKKILPEATDG
jgi:hypothetical protein